MLTDTKDYVELELQSPQFIPNNLFTQTMTDLKLRHEQDYGIYGNNKMQCVLDIDYLKTSNNYKLNVQISTGAVRGYFMDSYQPLFDDNEDTGFSVAIQFKFGLQHIFKPIIIIENGEDWWDEPELIYSVPLTIINKSIWEQKLTNKTKYRLLFRLKLQDAFGNHTDKDNVFVYDE